MALKRMIATLVLGGVAYRRGHVFEEAELIEALPAHYAEPYPWEDIEETAPTSRLAEPLRAIEISAPDGTWEAMRRAQEADLMPMRSKY